MGGRGLGLREANGVSWRPLTTPNTVATPQNSQDWQRKDRVGKQMFEHIDCCCSVGYYYCRRKLLSAARVAAPHSVQKCHPVPLLLLLLNIEIATKEKGWKGKLILQPISFQRMHHHGDFSGGIVHSTVQVFKLIYHCLLKFSLNFPDH